jgi:hypothetical protein
MKPFKIGETLEITKKAGHAFNVGERVIVGELFAKSAKVYGVVRNFPQFVYFNNLKRIRPKNLNKLTKTI